MKVIENLQSETINEHVKTLARNVTAIDTDDSTSYVDLKDFVLRHKALFNHLLVACVSYKNEYRYV